MLQLNDTIEFYNMTVLAGLKISFFLAQLGLDELLNSGGFNRKKRV